MTVYFSGMTGDDSLLTIDQLATAVANALAAWPVEGLNGRIRAVPDVRTLRYYTTLGLLDRPARWEGRTAFYNRRHVLQLLSIKRLQAQGLSLAEVQASLLNSSDENLARLAQLPADFQFSGSQATRSEDRQRPTSVSTSVPRQPDRPFWKTRPQAQSASLAAASPAPASTTLSPESRATKLTRDITSVLLGVPLDPAVSLLVQAARPLDEQDLQALREVAQPLLAALRSRQLIA